MLDLEGVEGPSEVALIGNEEEVAAVAGLCRSRSYRFSGFHLPGRCGRGSLASPDYEHFEGPGWEDPMTSPQEKQPTLQIRIFHPTDPLLRFLLDLGSDLFHQESN